MASLSDFEKGLCTAAGERAAEALLEQFRPLVAAVTREHKAVAALVKAGKTGTDQSVADAWSETRAAHEAVESLLAADEGGEG